MTEVTEHTHTQAYCIAASTWGAHSSWILVGWRPTLAVTCPMHSCTASLCVCVLGLECTEESGWVGVSDPDLSATRHIPGWGGGQRTLVECEPHSVDLTQWPPSEGHSGCGA